MDEDAPPRLGRQLLLLVGLYVVIGLIVAGLVAAPILAVDAKMNEPGEYGMCDPFSMRCHDVPLETIAATAGVDFPERTEVISSATSRPSTMSRYWTPSRTSVIISVESRWRSPTSIVVSIPS
jgi:hypothetical protein